VAQHTFSDAALVLIGHGSSVNADSGAAVFQHAAELRGRNIFVEVREGFWKQEPRLLDVIQQLAAPRVFLVPLFISAGYFSQQVIPKALGFPPAGQGSPARVQTRSNQTLFYCEPFGTHVSMARVLLSRASEVVARFPFPRAPQPAEITLFIAGHGTEQNESSRVAIEHQAGLIRAQNLYAAVHAIFLEEEPRIGACFDLAQSKNIVIVPFFVSEGMHVQEDIPALLGEPERLVKQRLKSGQATWRNPTEKKGKLVWYAASIGSDPHIADVILERVREAAQWPQRDE
jgi:sirohydrochlorin cobaltochelatase